MDTRTHRHTDTHTRARAHTHVHAHTAKQRRDMGAHQPRVPNGDDEVKVGLQARLLGWGVLLHLPTAKASHCASPREL